MSNNIYDLNMSNENTNYFRNFIPRDRRAERRRRKLRHKKINLKDLHSNRTIRKYIKYPTYSFVETLPIIIHNKYTTYDKVKDNYYKNMTINELIKKHFPKKVRFSSRISYLGEEEYVEEEKEELEEKYPDSEEEVEKDLSSCWNTEELKKAIALSIKLSEQQKQQKLEEEEELKKALELSIMTNNVDIVRKKHNYPTLGKAEFEEDELEKWKYECDKLTKQKNPCRKLIEKRKDLYKTLKYILGRNNKCERKKFYKKYNYINSLMKKKYGYNK